MSKQTVAHDSTETLAAALYLARGKSKAHARAATALDGCPVGGWGETQQAFQRLEDDLPLRSMRAYTIAEFVAAAYTVDHADRYRTRVAS